MALNVARAQEQTYSYWLKKNWYYHALVTQFYSFIVPKEVRVLQFGCKNGYLLHAVRPSYGVGIGADALLRAEAEQNNRGLIFCQKLTDIPAGTTFDYIILSAVTMEVDDVQDFLTQLHPLCHAGTRIVIDTYSYLWEPILRIAQKCGLRRPTSLQHWLSSADMINFLSLADFEMVTQGGHMLVPLRIPFVSWFFNHFIAQLPLINRLCLNKWIIARPKPKSCRVDYSVSVIIPCRNERGNIEACVSRCPQMGKKMELIFVEGHSQDGSYDEIVRVAQKYKDREISVLKQPGKGKGDAVRTGFAHANYDILIILDADLTTPPEEMPKFVEALVSGRGEFINGSRLIYGMESESMRFLNLLANYCFGLGFSWLLGQRIKDTLCGTKVLFKNDYEKIAKNRSYFGQFDPFGDFDLIFGAAKQNLKIVDMPVHYKRRVYGTSQISRFSAGFLLLRMSIIGWKKFKLRIY